MTITATPFVCVDPTTLPRREARTYKGQTYWQCGPINHVTKDGREVELDKWFTYCAKCGNPFTFKAMPGSKYLNRRCEGHQRPGTPVVLRDKSRDTT